MKLLVIFLLTTLILITGCEGREISRYSVAYGYDFTPYTAKGFLFTPESYNGDYESVGIIEMELYPSVKKYGSDTTTQAFNTWERAGQSYWYIEPILARECIDSLYHFAKDRGADAITRLDISKTDEVSNGRIVYRGIKAKGFAIKRRHLP